MLKDTGDPRPIESSETAVQSTTDWKLTLKVIMIAAAIFAVIWLLDVYVASRPS